MGGVTFVVTTYKRPEWLRECLDSIPRDAHVIVVDDALEHTGYAKARMRGLAQVSSEFVAFLDDDDVLLPEWLPEHLRLMDQADVVAGSYFETDADLSHRLPVILEPPTIADFVARTCPVNDGALIRRSVLSRITWHPERDTAMMFSLWHDLLLAGVRFAATPGPTWLHRLHGANMSAHLTKQDARWRAVAVA